MTLLAGGHARDVSIRSSTKPLKHPGREVFHPQVRIHYYERSKVLGINCLSEDFAGPDTSPPFWSAQGNLPHKADPQRQPLGMLAHNESVVWPTPAAPET